MSGNTTLNTTPVIRANVYSQLMLEGLYDMNFFDGVLYRDVTDFGDGTTLTIPTVGELPLYDIDPELEPYKIAQLDTGTLSLTINRFKQTGGAVTDKLKEDAYLWQEVESRIVPEGMRKIREAFETDLFAAANAGQTAADPNTVNGWSHRWVAGATNNVVSVEDFIYMKLAFDKANVPEEGRVAIVDPVVEATLNNLTNLVNVSNNPMFEGIVNSGFAMGKRFIRNIYGFDVWVSNRLPLIASETITGGPQAASTAVTTGVANEFMCLADDMCKPLMSAWRRMPKVEGDRNVQRERDEFYVTARWGAGVQRKESLGVIITEVGNYK